MERCFDDAELQYLREALQTQQLYRGTRGNFVARFEEAMAAHLGRTYVYAVNSGTSANEAAVVGLGLEPGDEISDLDVEQGRCLWGPGHQRRPPTRRSAGSRSQ